MRSRLRWGLGTLLFIAGPLAAVVALHRLGSIEWLRIDWTDPVAWFTRATIEEALAATLRSVGLIAAYWLAGSTSAYLFARTSRIPNLIRAVGSITLPLARRMTDGLVVGSLAITTMAPLSAQSPDPVVSTPAPIVQVLPQEDLAPPRETHGASRATIQTDIGIADQPERIHTVMRGDNLWTIAEGELERRLGRRPTEPEISAYWRNILAVNRDELRSGDPDLIYPGESIRLPSPAAG